MIRLHRHAWATAALNQVTLVSPGGGAPEDHRTDLLQRCTRCGRHRVRSLSGSWTAEEIAAGSPR